MWDALCFMGSAWAAEGAEVAASPMVVAVQAMPPVADAWNQLLSTVITVFIIPAVGYGAVLARAWVKSKTDKIKNDELRAAADYAMQRLDRIVGNVVKEIQQTKSTDGEPITPEKAKQLLSIAYSRVKAQITDDIMETVKTAVKDSDRYIVTKIEAAVGDEKRSQITVETKAK
jgi:sensor c-di-GMP phosphodiesterase-like protein